MSQQSEIRGRKRAFARVLRELRIRRRVSQMVLAHKAGIEPSHYGKLERGEYAPEYATIDKLARCHGMGMLDLLNLVEYCRKYPRRKVPG